MIFNYYYLDFLLILREIFLMTVILISLCLYTLIEKVFKKTKKEISFFYSVSLYFIMVLCLYLFSSISYIQTYYYLFNYSISNLYGIDYLKLILIVMMILIFYASFSDKTLQSLKKIPFEVNYILAFLFLGMVFLLYSFDFLMIFLNLELQNFSLYILEQLNILRI